MQPIEPGPPTPRRRRRTWLVAALLLFGGGAATVTVGVVRVVRDVRATESAAIVRGRVGALGHENPGFAEFTAAKAQAYTVYIVVDTDSDDTRDAIVGATRCDVVFANGGSASVSGANQINSTTTGSTSTVGTFDAPEGGVRVACQQVAFGSSFDQGHLGGEPPFFVSPGEPSSGGPIVTIVIGAFLAAGGLCLFFVWLGSNRRARGRRAAQVVQV